MEAEREYREYDVWMCGFPEPVMLPESDWIFHKVDVDRVIAVDHRDRLFRITRDKEDYRLAVEAINPDDLPYWEYWGISHRTTSEPRPATAL